MHDASMRLRLAISWIVHGLRCHEAIHGTTTNELLSQCITLRRRTGRRTRVVTKTDYTRLMTNLLQRSVVRAMVVAFLVSGCGHARAVRSPTQGTDARGDGHSPGPATKPAAEPTTASEAKPATEPTTRLATESTTKLAAKPATGSTTGSTTRPTTKSADRDGKQHSVRATPSRTEPVPEQNFIDRIYFRKNDSRLASGHDVLDAFAGVAASDGMVTLVLIAHADGAERDPQRLSARRAETIKEYLITRGVPENRLQVRIIGAREQLHGPVDEASNGATNRCVQLVVEKPAR